MWGACLALAGVAVAALAASASASPTCGAEDRQEARLPAGSALFQAKSSQLKVFSDTAEHESISLEEEDDVQNLHDGAFGKSLLSGKAGGVDGHSATLDEAGYAAVAGLCCHLEMTDFVKRVIDAEAHQVCDEGALHGFVHWYMGCTPKYTRSYEDMRGDLFGQTGLKNSECVWITERGNDCGSLRKAGCQTFLEPGEHRRRVCADTDPNACKQAQSDWVIAFDASDHIDDQEWEVELEFVAQLVEFILGGANSKQHQVSVYAYNTDTYPIGSTTLTANTLASFTRDVNALSAAVRNLKTSRTDELRKAGADHPQVIETANATLVQNGKFGAADRLILVTGDTTRDGKCVGLDNAAVDAKLGSCIAGTKTQAATCVSNVASESCTDQCKCGLYNAQLFKDGGATITVLAVARTKITDTAEEAAKVETLSKSMEAMSSPAQYIRTTQYAHLEMHLHYLLSVIGCK